MAGLAGAPGAPQPARVPWPALVVVLAGVSAALQVGKLPPAVPALQASLGIGLVEAGFLLSLVQLAGMTLGMVAGLLADGIGLRRCMLAGLMLVAGASAAGALVPPGPQALRALLLLRVLEGVGFLLVVMPGPALVRALSPPNAERLAMGFWGTYMPLGIALGLLLGPAVLQAWGWPAWWMGLGAASALAALLVWRSVPSDAARAMVPSRAGMPARSAPWPQRVALTLRTTGAWHVALAFAVYASQWMAVVGFLPAVYAGAGISAGASALLTSLVAALNIAGNLLGGRLLQRGTAPAHVLRLGFLALAAGGLVAFAQWGPTAWLPPAVRYLAVCAFSLFGGVVPATLFALAVRVAPTPGTVSSTVGLMQQASACGQLLAPPAVAWLARQVGGWHWTWAFTLACSAAGLVLAGRLGRHGSGRVAA